MRLFLSIWIIFLLCGCQIAKRAEPAPKTESRKQVQAAEAEAEASIEAPAAFEVDNSFRIASFEVLPVPPGKNFVAYAPSTDTPIWITASNFCLTALITTVAPFAHVATYNHELRNAVLNCTNGGCVSLTGFCRFSDTIPAGTNQLRLPFSPGSPGFVRLQKL